MIYKNPSRILNENTTFLGLTIVDFAGIGYLLIISHTGLSKINIEYLSFILTGIILIFLISIRAKYRSKIIRDYLSFKFNKRISFKIGIVL